VGLPEIRPTIKLALVLPSQHPAHIAFVQSQARKSFGALKLHRDGTTILPTYEEPAGNPNPKFMAGR